MKGIFNAYVLLPFDKKLISILVMQMRTRHFLKVKISYLLQSPTSSGEVICVCNLLHVTTILKYILILLIFINHYILSIPQSKLFSWFPGFPQVWPEKLAKNYMRPKNNFFSLTSCVLSTKSIYLKEQKNHPYSNLSTYEVWISGVLGVRQNKTVLSVQTVPIEWGRHN